MRFFTFLEISGIVLIFSLASCAGPNISTPNTTQCTAAGHLFLGTDCATTNTGAMSSLSYTEAIDFLEPQTERTCVPVPGFSVCSDNQSSGVKVKLAARAGAVSESDDDFTRQKTAFEQACVELKDRCTPEMKAAFHSNTAGISSILSNVRKKMGLPE